MRCLAICCCWFRDIKSLVFLFLFVLLLSCFHEMPSHQLAASSYFNYTLLSSWFLRSSVWFCFVCLVFGFGSLLLNLVRCCLIWFGFNLVWF